MFLGHRHRIGIDSTRSSLLELSPQLTSLFPEGKEKNAFIQSEELFQEIAGIQDWGGGGGGPSLQFLLYEYPSEVMSRVGEC